jgi:hypothetical protein
MGAWGLGYRYGMFDPWGYGYFNPYRYGTSAVGDGTPTHPSITGAGAVPVGWGWGGGLGGGGPIVIIPNEAVRKR